MKCSADEKARSIFSSSKWKSELVSDILPSTFTHVNKYSTLNVMSHHLQNHLSKTEQKFIDKLMSAAAVIHPLTAMPQIYDIYSTQSAAGVSLWTWLGFMVLGLIFLAYGLLHRLKPIIVTQILWFIVDFLIVLGVLLYK